MLRQSRGLKVVSTVVMICFFGFQATCLFPREALAGADTDLKRIEYKYYFRGDYTKAISELRQFLEREDVADEQVREAREYLAASLIMTGASDEGKAQFLKLLKKDGAYKGPDPGVFKSIVVSTFDQAKSEYASAVIRTAPDTGITSAADSSTEAAAPAGKPVYKKWWFYATMGVVLLAIAGAASGGGDNAPPADTGRVTVGIQVQ
ncbi:MAG: tol-pal system YbgF family protein [Candidatus Krumholzibacteriia bacterium]